MHTCSYAQDGCADYIFFKPSEEVQLVRAFLHPEDIPFGTAWNATSGWDPRSSSVLPSTLSDHRPLVADFQLKDRGNVFTDREEGDIEDQ